MINHLSDIEKNLQDFDALSPSPLNPFWELPEFVNDGYWDQDDADIDTSENTMVISGPSRNGNHLVHSLFDNHSALPNAPGEDSFMAAFFNDLLIDYAKAIKNLRSENNVEYILNLSGYGLNKWKELSELNSKKVKKTDVWSGVQTGEINFVADYQDTIVEIDYQSYYKRLNELSKPIAAAKTFISVFRMYMDAFKLLDRQSLANKKYGGLLVGSGMRSELSFLLPKSNLMKCITPIRPFESYYYSFAKVQFKTVDIKPEILKEAWEHWHHKVIDYLILKKAYPDKLCLVNYDHLVNEPEATIKELCNFLNIEFEESCLTPSVMGVLVKGNSSFSKEETNRGKIYKTSSDRKLPEKDWPELYPDIWNMITKFAI